MCNNDHRLSCDTSELRREQATRTYRKCVFACAWALEPSFVIGNEAGDVAKKLPVSLLRSLQPWSAPRQSAEVRHSASWVLYSVNALVAVIVNFSSVVKSIFGSLLAKV